MSTRTSILVFLFLLGGAGMESAGAVEYVPWPSKIQARSLSAERFVIEYCEKAPGLGDWKCQAIGSKEGYTPFEWEEIYGICQTMAYLRAPITVLIQGAQAVSVLSGSVFA